MVNRLVSGIIAGKNKLSFEIPKELKDQGITIEMLRNVTVLPKIEIDLL